MKKKQIKNKTLRNIVRKGTKWYYYCVHNVWKDQRRVWYVDLIKTINLSVSSYLDKGVQSRAKSLTYSTLLAIVPAFALVLAIARGFGFQEIIKSELRDVLPSQEAMVDTVLVFVDKYLATTSGGVFVGIGILFLLWTLISLLRSIETTFNYVWGVKKGRSPYRMITDYTTIIIVLPILLICSSGISIFMSSMVQDYINNPVMSPVVKFLLDIAPWIFTCLFFSGMYILIPYTKVKPRYALISGFICGSLFRLLQYLFMAGQMYVTKYNAVYGSFSFLPLFMIWMYLTWLICISGVLLTYASQNIFRFSYVEQIRNISRRYSMELAVYVALIVVGRFERGESPMSKFEMSRRYNVPIQLLNKIIDKFVDAGVFSQVQRDDEVRAYQPAVNLSGMSVCDFLNMYNNIGISGFIPELRNDRTFLEIARIVGSDADSQKSVKLGDLLPSA